MKIISKNGKSFLRISKSEWVKIASNFDTKDLLDWLSEPSDKDLKKKKAQPSIDGDYTIKNPLKSMPEKPIATEQEVSEQKPQRSVKVEQGQAYEMIPKSNGEIVRRQISLLGVNSPEDLERISKAPKGQEMNVREEIIRDKIRSSINTIPPKQFIFIGFWEKTKASTFRHIYGQIIGKIDSTGNYNNENWIKLRIFDRAIQGVREMLIDNIDYIRGKGVSYVVDRIARNAHVNEKYPEGKVSFVGSALSAARQAFEESKKQNGDKA